MYPRLHMLWTSTSAHYQMIWTVSWPELGYVFNMLWCARVVVLSDNKIEMDSLEQVSQWT